MQEEAAQFPNLPAGGGIGLAGRGDGFSSGQTDARAHRIRRMFAWNPIFRDIATLGNAQPTAIDDVQLDLNLTGTGQNSGEAVFLAQNPDSGIQTSHTIRSAGTATTLNVTGNVIDWSTLPTYNVQNRETSTETGFAQFRVTSVGGSDGSVVLTGSFLGNATASDFPVNTSFIYYKQS